jgi:LuxR family transcriptional regulator
MKDECVADVAHSLLVRLQRKSPASLSGREIAFLRLASQGKTAGEIAAATAVTERTANFHIANAIEKLGASNKTHAVALAMRLGLLE